MEVNELRERHKNLQFSESDERTAKYLRRGGGSVMIRILDQRGETVECRSLSIAMVNQLAGMFDESAANHLNRALGETLK